MIKQLTYWISLGVLLIFYAVGLFGILGENGEWFASLTPISLILTALLVWINQRFSWRDIVFILLAGSVGYAFEVLGVSTGLIFGSYWYGENLGPKLLEVPVVIALNWVLLLYITLDIASRLRLNRLMTALVSAVLMVTLDFVLEPVAIMLDFWHWENESIPVQNYVGWLVIAFGLALAGTFIRKEIANRLGLATYIVLLIWFTLIILLV